MRPLIIVGLLFALIVSALPANAQESLSTMSIRVNNQTGPVRIDYADFDFEPGDRGDLLSNAHRCIAFHNTDKRTATAVRFAFVFYDGGGIRSGSQIYTRTGSFGTDIKQGSYRDAFQPGPNDCFLMHLPDAHQSTIAYYVDSVDFADGTKWVAQALTFPDHVIAGSLVPVPPPERPQSASGALAPAVAGAFVGCAATAALPPAALEHSVFVSVEPGAPIGDGLFRIGTAAVCRASADPARDAAAVDTVKAMPAAVVRSGAFRVYFPEIAVSATCTAPVRLMDRKLLDSAGHGARSGARPGDYLALAHVSVRADGFASNVVIARSAHEGIFDEALRESAFSTRYWPAIQNGVPVAGTYDFPMRWLVEAAAHPDERGSEKVFGPPVKFLPADCLTPPKA